MQSRQTLNAWQDWSRSIGRVLSTLSKSPRLLLSLVLLCLLINFAPIPPVAVVGLRIAASCLTAWLSYNLVLECAGIPIPESPVDSEGKPVRPLVQLWLLSVEYYLATEILMLLLIVPGVIVGVNSSLGIQFVCLEKLDGMKGLRASRELLKGKFWLAFKYLFPITACYFIPYLLAQVGLGFVSAILKEHGAQNALTDAILLAVITVLDFISYVFPLTILPLQTKLYQSLKGLQPEPAADSQPEWPHK